MAKPLNASIILPYYTLEDALTTVFNKVISDMSSRG